LTNAIGVESRAAIKQIAQGLLDHLLPANRRSEIEIDCSIARMEGNIGKAVAQYAVWAHKVESVVIADQLK
jgi:hypothetical protein